MAKKMKLSHRLFVTFMFTSLIALLSFAVMSIIQAMDLYRTGTNIIISQTRKSLDAQFNNQVRLDVAKYSFTLFEEAYSTYKQSLTGQISRKQAEFRIKTSLINSSLLKNAGVLILDNQAQVIANNKMGSKIKDIKGLLKKVESLENASQQSHILMEQVDFDNIYNPSVIAFRSLSRWKWTLIIVVPAANFRNYIDRQAATAILQNLNFGTSGYVEILDETGKVLYHPYSELNPQVFHKKQIDKIIEKESHKVKVSLSEDTNDYHSLLQMGQDIRDYQPTEIKTITYLHNPTNQWIVAVHTYNRDSKVTLRRFKLTIILLCFVFLALTTLISFSFSRRLGKNLNTFNHRLASMASRTEKTDLTERISVGKVTELSDMASKFNTIMQNFNKDMLKVKYAAHDLSQTSHEMSDTVIKSMKASMESISTTIQSIQENTLNQTSGVEEVNATLEEMSRSIDSMSENMSRQSAAVEESASAIEEMSRNIDNASATAEKTTSISKNLNQVATEGGEAVKNSMASIKDVSEYSQQILKMLKLITDISKQTNLLAMNASIEAAHAGEAGKGFAIVADEIRRLAENTSKNAKDIGDVVNAIVEKIEDSVTLAEKAGMGLDMILAYSNQNVNIMSQLNSALEEQNHSAKEILKSTQDMVSVTEEVQVAMTEQKTGTHEFGEIMSNLRDISIETKDSIQSHIDKLNTLIRELDAVDNISDKNSHLSSELMALINQFVLSETLEEDEESTSLKLVE